MGQVIGTVVPFVAFVVLYELLRRREQRRRGVKPPVQWGWLIAIFAAAAVAMALGHVH